MPQLSDQEVLDMVSNYNIQKVNMEWMNQQNKESLFQRISNNDDIWNFSYIGKILDALTRFKLNASQLDNKIIRMFESIREKPEKINLETLSLVMIHSQKYLPSFTPVFLNSFKDKFLSEDKWETYTSHDLIIICKALNENYLQTFNSLPENFECFLNRVLEVIEKVSIEDLGVVEDFMRITSHFSLAKVEKLHKLAAVRLFGFLTDNMTRKTNEQNHTILKIILGLRVDKEVRIFIGKIFADSIINNLQKFGKKVANVDFEAKICVLILKMMMDLKLFYPEFMILIRSVFKIKSVDRGFKSNTSALYEAMAFFNIMELENYFSVEKNFNLKNFINLIMNEENIIYNRLVVEHSSSENFFNFVNVAKYLWCCCVLNQNIPNLADYVDYLNKFNTSVEPNLQKKMIQIRNWLKFEIKFEKDLNIPSASNEIEFYSNVDQDAAFDKKFKDEVRKWLPANYLMNYEYSGVVVDFFDPEMREAIFLDTSSCSTTYNGNKILLGEALANQRFLEAMGNKVKLLTVQDFINK